jgi:hypothetical protein
MGVDPSQASAHSAITRPRISGLAASWRVVLARELKVMLPYPTKTRAASSRARFGAAAAARMVHGSLIVDV